jgi:hypothetical protein
MKYRRAYNSQVTTPREIYLSYVVHKDNTECLIGAYEQKRLELQILWKPPIE